MRGFALGLYDMGLQSWLRNEDCEGSSEEDFWWEGVWGAGVKVSRGEMAESRHKCLAFSSQFCPRLVEMSYVSYQPELKGFLHSKAIK